MRVSLALSALTDTAHMHAANEYCDGFHPRRHGAKTQMEWKWAGHRTWEWKVGDRWESSEFSPHPVRFMRRNRSQDEGEEMSDRKGQERTRRGVGRKGRNASADCRLAHHC
eukprot:166492-Rhodomonas_salina.2